MEEEVFSGTGVSEKTSLNGYKTKEEPW